jgi:hypothetical protein
MTTKNSSGEPVGDDAQRSKQRQQPKPAPEPFKWTEWAFHKLKRGEELRYCALWELARLRGSKQKPWLKLSERAKEKFMVSEQDSLQEIPATVGPALSAFFGKKPSPLKTITFLVDLSEGEGKLCDAFLRWLRSSPQRKRWRMKPKATKDRWRSLLSKIVILRATEAGLKWPAAKEATADLWKKWKLDLASQGLLSQSHWDRALNEAKALRRKTVIEKLFVDPPFDGDAYVVGPPFFRVMIGRTPVITGQVKPGAMPAAK